MYRTNDYPRPIRYIPPPKPRIRKYRPVFRKRPILPPYKTRARTRRTVKTKKFDGVARLKRDFDLGRFFNNFFPINLKIFSSLSAIVYTVLIIVLFNDYRSSPTNCVIQRLMSWLSKFPVIHEIIQAFANSPEKLFGVLCMMLIPVTSRYRRNSWMWFVFSCTLIMTVPKTQLIVYIYSTWSILMYLNSPSELKLMTSLLASLPVFYVLLLENNSTYFSKGGSDLPTIVLDTKVPGEITPKKSTG